MIKREELANPDSCMNRASEDEMTFVVLGRDAAAPATLRFWIQERIRLGRNQPGDTQLVEAESSAATMDLNRRMLVGNFPKTLGVLLKSYNDVCWRERWRGDKFAPKVLFVSPEWARWMAENVRDSDGVPTKFKSCTIVMDEDEEAFRWAW